MTCPGLTGFKNNDNDDRDGGRLRSSLPRNLLSPVAGLVQSFSTHSHREPTTMQVMFLCFQRQDREDAEQGAGSGGGRRGRWQPG